VVRAALKVEGIATVLAARTDGDTGFCITLVEPDGERTFVTMPGVEAELRPGDLSALRPERDDVIARSGYDLAYPVSGPVLTDWLSTAPTDGARIALDPGPLVAEIPPELRAAVLPRLWLLTMNQREARLFSRADDASGADLVDAVRRVPGLAADALVVVREGAAGCVAAGGGLGSEPRSFPAPEVTAVDTTGAGDTHTGVLLAALAAGRDVTAAIELATRAAALSVTRLGPATAPSGLLTESG
jgi:sugar/nucleoside kinase (ribokinase family)